MGNYPIPTESLDLGGESLVLRGLSLPAIINIAQAIGEPLADLYKKAATGQLSGDVSSIAMELGTDFALFAGLVISHGADKPDQLEYFGFHLPLGHQVKALEIVGRLTAEGAGGPEKLVEIITKVLAGINQMHKKRKR